ncbi:MAG: 4Fe-4S dicluster domain-containing protein [Desulfovibrionaceae bacterium]|jgi:molybdopterin-containing oxidoreductase family iron-sulfur binding subunit|nr:4Fe-4S dicluster domain-containing protein [Desulfovibrionaceae bacterium]
MKATRRKFLKIAGVSALGLAAAPAVSALTGMTGEAAAQEAAFDASRYAPSETGFKAKRWAMVIDSRAFETPEDFAKCIEACHKYHNVPHIESKKEVKWIWEDTVLHAFPEQHNNFQAHAVEERKYLLLCNHCENPPCVRVCPTKATFKREDGIVMMDMHRCIGCRFCMAACPYGSRSFNFWDPRKHMEEVSNPTYPTRMKGVVEKCDFCYELLDKGEMPKCVEASEGKIQFGDLGDPESELRKTLAENYTIRRKPALGTEPGVYYII